MDRKPISGEWTRRAIHRVLQRVRVTSIDDLRTVADLKVWWVFRGQASWRWRLEPHLERECPRSTWAQVEEDELRAIRASRPHGPPDEKDTLSWLALLRHNGRPVRLLDFTRRLPVALHFATRQPTADHPAIWAVDGPRLEIAWRNQVTAPSELLIIPGTHANCAEFNRLYERPSQGPAAMLVEPQPPNRRQRLQSGLYLVGLDLTKSLEENLFECLGHRPTQISPTIRPDGVATGPIGFFTSVEQADVKRNLADALVIQIILDIPTGEIREFLAEEGVNDELLGLQPKGGTT